MNLTIKYRPKKLDEVKGHKKVIKELSKRSKEDNFPQVMMFAGKTGLGKSTLQRIIAKNILCMNKDEIGNCCNQCEVCKTIDYEKLSNYCFEYNASNLGIDDMRLIEEKTMIKNLGKVQRKVFVIDELQELASNKKAQKNILKMLERQYKNVYFILGTMDITKVDKAIRDRSVIYLLHDIETDDIIQELIYICDQEKYEIKEENQAEMITTIAHSSNGIMRAAISYLERIIYSELKDTDDVEKEIGIITEEKLAKIINGLLAGDISILNTRIREEIYERLTDKLNVYYKYISGLKINDNILKYLYKFDTDIVAYTIRRLNDLMNFRYLTTNLIEFIIVDIINYIKENKLKKKVNEEKITPIQEQPRRRKRVE